MNCSETKTADNHAEMSELDLYRKRYRHCRRLIDNDPRFKEMSKEEKDTYAQSLATPEYLDLTCDWAFKYLFQNHPDMLIMLLNDILRENITSIEFRNTELAKDAQHDKRILFDLLCKTPSGTILVEMQKASRSDQRDRLFFYGARLINRQVKKGDDEYVLTPVKVICIMNYEDTHPDSPEDKILYHYRIQEVDTSEPFGDQISFYLLELPRIMHYTDEYDSPVAGWCRIFRNFAIFAKSRSKDDERFGRLEKAMRVSGLDDNEIDNYFSVMLTEKEMRPYIEGAKQQGYRIGHQEGFKDGVEKGKAEGRAEGKVEGQAEGRDAAMTEVAKSLLAQNMPIDQIAQIVGLPHERIKSLSQG